MKKIILLLFIISIFNLFAQIPLTEHEQLKHALKKVEPKKEVNDIQKVKEEDSEIIDSTSVINISNQISKPEESNEINLELLQESAFQIIDRLNVKDMELRDIFRGIAYQYKINLFVNNELTQPVTLYLSDISVIDCILFICDEYNLKIKQTGNILRIYLEEQVKPELEELTKFNIIYRNDSLSVDISSADIKKVIRYISEISNRNIIIQPGVKGNISGFFQNLAFNKCLEILMENNGFKVRKKDNIFYIDYDKMVYTDKGETNRSLWINVDNDKISFELMNADITMVVHEIAQQLDISIVTYGTPGGQITAKCSDLSLEEALNLLLKETDFTYKLENDVYIIGNKNIRGLVTSKLIKLQHISSEGIIELLPDLIKKNASIKTIKEQNAIMVIGTNDVILEFENFIYQIDHPTPQILIEALVVDFNSSDIRDLGILMGTNSTTNDSIGWKNFSLLDVGFNEQGYFYTQHDGQSVNKQLTNFSNWLGAKNIGVLPDNFYIKIQALESEGIANVRSRPQIATLNGHTASISIGTTQYYILKTTTPVTSADNIITQETERFVQVDANITLSITPWVSASGEVTVEIHPEFKTPVGIFSSEIPPTINTRVIDSTVRLKDGETIILGGLIEEKESKSHSKVPILGDIPILGNLFRTSHKSIIKTELMIYITPHIFYGDESDTEKWDTLKNNYKLEDK